MDSLQTAASHRTRFTETELRQFRDILLRKRAEITEDLRGLSDDVRFRGHSEEGSCGPHAPSHLAESASDTWMQCFALCLLNNEHTLLREIDAALDRIDKGVYGICEATGKPVSRGRLRALPWARYCIEYARFREAG